MIQHVLRRRAPLTELPGSCAQGDAAGWAAARRLLQVQESSTAVAAPPEASPSPAPDASQTQIKYEDAPDTAAIVGGTLAVRVGWAVALRVAQRAPPPLPWHDAQPRMGRRGCPAPPCRLVPAPALHGAPMGL